MLIDLQKEKYSTTYDRIIKNSSHGKRFKLLLRTNMQWASPVQSGEQMVQPGYPAQLDAVEEDFDVDGNENLTIPSLDVYLAPTSTELAGFEHDNDHILLKATCGHKTNLNGIRRFSSYDEAIAGCAD